jgi:hypothetical protein
MTYESFMMETATQNFPMWGRKSQVGEEILSVPEPCSFQVAEAKVH